MAKYVSPFSQLSGGDGGSSGGYSSPFTSLASVQKQRIATDATYKAQEDYKKKIQTQLEDMLAKGEKLDVISSQLDISQKDLQDYVTQYRPDYVKSQKSFIDQASENIGTFGKGLWEGLTSQYKRIGEGNAQVLAQLTGVADKERENYAQMQKSYQDTIISSLNKLKTDKNLTDEQKAALRKTIDTTSVLQNQSFSDFAAKQADIAEKTDPVKAAAAAAEIGLDILTAGSLKGASAIFKGADAVKGAQVGLKTMKLGKVLETASKTMTTAEKAAGLARLSALTGTQATGYGALGTLESKGSQATAEDIKSGALSGATFGVVAPLAGALLVKGGKGVKGLFVKAAGETEKAVVKADTAAAKADLENILKSASDEGILQQQAIKDIVNAVDSKASASQIDAITQDVANNIANKTTVNSTTEQALVDALKNAEARKGIKKTPIATPEVKAELPVEKPIAPKTTKLSEKTASITKLVKNTPFKAETEISNINDIIKNKQKAADGQKLKDYYKNEKGQDWSVKNMTPDEYLRRAAIAMGNTTPEDIARFAERPMGNPAKYAEDMAKGDKFPMPWINEVTGAQEGRTRALAAKKLGYKEIPVAVAEKYVPKKEVVKEITKETKQVTEKKTLSDKTKVKKELTKATDETNKYFEGTPVRTEGTRKTSAKYAQGKDAQSLLIAIERDKEALADGLTPEVSQSRLATRLAAIDAGDLGLENIKKGTPVNAVELDRARLEFERTATDVAEKLFKGEVELAGKDLALLKKKHEGYQNIKSEPGRALTQLNFDKKASAKELNIIEQTLDYAQTFGKDLSQLTMKEIKDIRAFMEKEIKKQESNAERKAKFGGRFSSVKDYITGDTNLLRKFEEWSTAAKLTSPSTYIVNFIGNSIGLAYRGIEQSLAVGGSTLAGRQSIKALAPAVFGTNVGWQNATVQLVHDLRDIMNAQYKEGAAAKSAREGYKHAIQGNLGERVRTPFYLLGAMDEFSKSIIKSSSMATDAYAMASKEFRLKGKPLKGEAFKNRVQQILDNPSKDILKRADDQALEYTYQKELGKMGKASSKLIGAIPGGKLFVPFLKTPTNIVKFALDHSLLGVPKNLYQATMKKGTVEGDRALARAVIGSTLTVGTTALVANNRDKITGSYPANAEEKSQWIAEGKTPYSIKIGDRWIPYGRVQPIGMLILQAKLLDDYVVAKLDGTAEKKEYVNQFGIKYKADWTAEDLFNGVAATIAGTVSELPFISGMTNFVDALNADPNSNAAKSASSYFENAIVGSMPAIMRDLTYFADDIKRKPQGLQEQIMAMTPGLSTMVAPDRTMTGEIIKREGNPWERSIFRVFGQKEKQAAPIYSILQNIKDNSSDNFQIYPPSTTQMGGLLDKTAYTKFRDLYYDKINSKLNMAMTMDSDFKSADVETQRDMLGMIVTAARDETKAEFPKYQLDKILKQYDPTSKTEAEKYKETKKLLQAKGII